jgi:hypothetical protein
MRLINPSQASVLLKELSIFLLPTSIGSFLSFIVIDQQVTYLTDDEWGGKISPTRIQASSRICAARGGRNVGLHHACAGID